MTSSAQVLSTVQVFDYLMKPGDPTATTPAALSNAEIRCTLTYDRAVSQSPVTNIAPKTLVTTTDTNGYWQFNLVPNASITPSGTLYVIQTPYSTYQISVTATPATQQASSIIANGVSVLSPATTNLTGPLTVAGALTSSSLTVGNLTAGQVPYADTAGLLATDSTFTFNKTTKVVSMTTLAATGAAAEAGTLANIYYLPAARGGGLDDSANIQAIIDACSAAGGGFVRPTSRNYTCNVTLKQGVVIWGAGHFAPSGTTPPYKFTQFGAGAVVDTPVTQIFGAGVIGMGFQGIGSGTAGQGVRFRNVYNGFIQKVSANNFADEGVKVDSASLGIAVEDVLCTNCVLNRARAAVIGACDIDGTDNALNRIEATVSGSIQGTVQSVNLYCCGIVVRGSNHFLDNLVGEISDVGIHVTATLSRFSNCRADLNYGHGWNIYGTSNMFATCLALSNSQDTTNTYDGFRADSTSGTNVFSACMVNNVATKKEKYGFEDLVNSDSAKNLYSNCFSSSALTAQYVNVAFAGSGFTWSGGAPKTFTANSTTPDAAGYERFITANSNPTTITDFTGGVSGQRIIVLCNDSNTTLQHNGATISMLGAGNRKLRSGVTYEFFRQGALWREVTQYPLGTSADNGDAAKTIQAKVDFETQFWATALTANRAVTLSTTGAYAGARFHIVRKAAATGASTLDVGTGPLKSLAVSQWCDVEYDGSAWFLSAFGSL